MSRLQEAIGLGLILGALHGCSGSTSGPKFHTGAPMTKHTETTSKVTETINSMDYNTGYQYSVTGSGISASGNLSPGTGTNNATIDGVTSSWTGIDSRPTFTQTTPGAAFQFTETYQGPGNQQPDNYKQNHRNRKRYGHYKYLLAIGLSFAFPSQTLANVGGVSATAAPVANSSGSVTNQAIQVLQGPYITNTYGSGIQCQGPTRNFTPYVTGSVSAAKPFEGYYDDPVYDVTDNFGAFDNDGNEIGDGILDNPGDIIFSKKTRTGQKDNYSLGLGFSMTWSTPTDKKMQELCKEAAQASIEMMRQQTANKRLDFEIARLKNCGDLKLRGIQFHPKSPILFCVCRCSCQ